MNGSAGDKHNERIIDKSNDKVNDKTNTQLPPRPLEDARAQNHQSRQAEPLRNHVLPSRSDFNDSQRSANPRPPEWTPDRGNLRINNDSRDADYRRGDRPGDSDYRASNRPHDRSHHSDRETQNSNWNGDRNSMSRSHNDRQHPRIPTKDEKSDRLQRDALPSDSRDHYREPELFSNAARPAEPSYSDRTALLRTSQEQDRSQHGRNTDRRHEGERSEPHGSTSTRPSRGSSPVRRVEDGASRSRYDDRQQVDHRRSMEQAPPRSRHDDSRQQYPSRSDHHGDNMQNSYGDRPRDDARTSHPVRQDPNSNWHKQESRLPPRQQDSSYGRLTQDPPAGPRTNNNPNTTSMAPRQTRSTSLQRAPNESKNSAPLSVPSSTSGGPTGGREPKRAASGYTRPPPITTTTTTLSTSISPSPDTAGIHPDRLRALQSVNASESSNNPRPSLAQAPAGPRNVIPEPSNTFDGGRSRSDKRFAQLNNVLSQTNGSPAPERPITRGRGEQVNEIIPPPPYSGSKDLPTPTSAGPRQEQFPNRGPPANPLRNNDEASGRRSLRSDDRQMPRSQDGYGHSDNARSKPGYRENNMRPPNGDMRDNRPRGSGPFPPQTPPLHNHQDRDRRPTRDNMQGSNDRSNGRRDSGREEWSAGEQQQRSGQSRRDHQQQDGGGSGRKRGRGNEEMYDHGPTAYDHSKRPRRG